MEPLHIQKIHVFQHKLLGKDWKPYIALIYGDNAFGKARIELFDSRKEVDSMEPHKVFLLDQCVSIKLHANAEHSSHIRLQLNSDIELRIKCDHISEFMDYLSAAAFPKKYVTIEPSTSVESSSSENDDVMFYDEYPVLLLVSTLTKKKYRAEGNYSLRFDNTVSITRCNNLVQQFPYSDINWVAIGENLLGISVENCGLLEFICYKPLLIIEHLRKHIKFKNSFPAVKLDMKRNYNRFYHQAREITASNTDLSHTSTLENWCTDTISTIQNNQQNSSTDEEQQSKIKHTEKYFNKIPSRKCSIFSEFFKRDSRKKLCESDRTKFEENADNEWMRLTLSPKTVNLANPTTIDKESEN